MLHYGLASGPAATAHGGLAVIGGDYIALASICLHAQPVQQVEPIMAAALLFRSHMCEYCVGRSSRRTHTGYNKQCCTLLWTWSSANYSILAAVAPF